MRRYLRALALFLLPFGLLFILTEGMLRRIPNDYSFKHQQLRTLGPSIRILALGSSGCFRDVDASIFPCPAFNAGNISQTPLHDLAIFEQHIDDFKALRHVVMTTSYGVLRMEPKTLKENWRAKNYVIYQDLPQFGREPKHFLELLNRPLKDQMKMLSDHYLKGTDNRVCDPLGMGLKKRILSAAELEENGKVDAHRHTSDRDYQVPVNTKAFKDLIELAASHNIKVLLVTPPAWRSYREAIDPKQFAEHTAVLRGLADSYSNVTYLSYFDDPAFEVSHYADADHLNPTGASLFTRKLLDHVSCGSP